MHCDKMHAHSRLWFWCSSCRRSVILYLIGTTGISPTKKMSRPFQSCIDCRDAFMFYGVTIVCTLVYALGCHARSLQAVVSVFILSPLSDSSSCRDELYIPGKMSARPFQLCIDCRDAFVFHGVTIVCTRVCALRYDARFLAHIRSWPSTS